MPHNFHPPKNITDSLVANIQMVKVSISTVITNLETYTLYIIKVCVNIVQ